MLANGKVLVAGGGTSAATAAAELYDYTTGLWTSIPSMTTARTLHCATLLTNGQVLVTGGQQGTIPVTTLSSAELYDPVGNAWHAVNSMLTARSAHTAIMLPSGNAPFAGKVLIAGGGGSEILAACELYTPSTGTWASTAAMNIPRTGQTATVLPNGDVLVTGGQSTTGITNTSEIYLVTGGTGSWAKPINMNTPRMGQTATLLPSGKVVVIGGVAPNVTPDSTIETLYNGGGDWNPGGTTLEHATGQAATLLPSGKVLVTGGLDSSGNPGLDADLYDPSTGTWEPTGSTTHEHLYHTSTLLQNGDVFVTGDLETPSEAEVYHSAVGTWTDIGPGEPSILYTATLLLNGKVLLAGGSDDTFASATNQCFLYDPAARTFSRTGSLNIGRFEHTATLLANGQVLVAGGADNDSDPIQACELYDPNTAQWTLGPNLMTTARVAHSAVLLPNGQVLVAGGEGWDGLLTNAEVFDPVTEQWRATGNMNADRENFTMTLLPDGMALAASGESDQNTNNVITGTDLYDPASGIWLVAGNMSVARERASGVLLPDGRVFVVGGYPVFTGSAIFPELFSVVLGVSASRIPQITSSNAIVYPGGSLTINGTLFRDLTGGSGGNNSANSPTDYPVVQLRNIETTQTAFLPASSWGTNFFISMPVTNFQAGFALATVFVNGIQSSSEVVLVSATAPVPIILTNLVRLPNGSFQFSFTNTPGAWSRAFGATNVATPFTNWTFLGNPTEISSGLFQFDDPQAANLPRRFYRVESP